MENTILNEYNKNTKLYNDFKNKIEILLKELLVINNLNYHNISSRVKNKDSLNKKILIKDKYSKIDEITDIVGTRIITYFDDDVENVVKILKNEFEIDESNSVNKKENIETDKFGYISYHLICQLKKPRNELNEYTRYKDLKFEIQIRSILQHAWAEIEHDLGYKTKKEIPKIIRRKFSRIAGLLETADEAFCDIKNKLTSYTESLDNTTTLMTEEINLDSIYKFTSNNELMLKINKEISKAGKWKGVYEQEKDDFSEVIKKFEFFNIKSIEEINNLITKYEKEIINFAKEWLKNNKESDKSINNTIGYFYLFYLLSYIQNNIKEYINFSSFSDITYDINEEIKRVCIQIGLKD